MEGCDGSSVLAVCRFDADFDFGGQLWHVVIVMTGCDGMFSYCEEC